MDSVQQAVNESVVPGDAVAAPAAVAVAAAAAAAAAPRPPFAYVYGAMCITLEDEGCGGWRIAWQLLDMYATAEEARAVALRKLVAFAKEFDCPKAEVRKDAKWVDGCKGFGAMEYARFMGHCSQTVVGYWTADVLGGGTEVAVTRVRLPQTVAVAAAAEATKAFVAAVSATHDDGGSDSADNSSGSGGSSGGSDDTDDDDVAESAAKRVRHNEPATTASAAPVIDLTA